MYLYKVHNKIKGRKQNEYRSFGRWKQYRKRCSISSGEGVCSALRQKNHKAVLVDVYFGKESFGEELFPEVYDVKAEADSMREMSKLVEETGKTRKEFFGPNVLSICKAADIVFLALHGANGEDGKVQSVFN